MSFTFENSPWPFSMDDLPAVRPPPRASSFTVALWPLEHVTFPVPLARLYRADHPFIVNFISHFTIAAGSAAKAWVAARRRPVMQATRVRFFMGRHATFAAHARQDCEPFVKSIFTRRAVATW